MTRRSNAHGYRVGLVGESHYQAAIRASRVGERVQICHERGNPHDAGALVVKSRAGETIGYVPRSSWLREAIVEEDRGVAARIDTIGSGGAGLLGVVLHVELNEDPVPRSKYGPAPPTGLLGWIARLLASR